MTASVYLIGAPGVGKSTLMDDLIRGYAVGEATAPAAYSPLVLEPLQSLGWPDDDGVYLGRHRDDFSGTDALSMGVLPAAARWAAEAPLPGLVIGEGARLAHPRFLFALAARGPLLVLFLAAPPGVIADRRRARGSSQSESWARGQATRSRNLAQQLVDAGIDVGRVWSSGPPEGVAIRARALIRDAGIALL